MQCENWDHRAREGQKTSVVDVFYHGVGGHTGQIQPGKSGKRINYSGLGAWFYIPGPPNGGTLYTKIQEEQQPCNSSALLNSNKKITKTAPLGGTKYKKKRKKKWQDTSLVLNFNHF